MKTTQKPSFHIHPDILELYLAYERQEMEEMNTVNDVSQGFETQEFSYQSPQKKYNLSPFIEQEIVSKSLLYIVKENPHPMDDEENKKLLKNIVYKSYCIKYSYLQMFHKFEFDKVEQGLTGNIKSFISNQMKPEISKFLSGHSTILIFCDPFMIEQNELIENIKICINNIHEKTEMKEIITEIIKEQTFIDEKKKEQFTSYISEFQYFSETQKKNISLHFLHVSLKDDIINCYRLISKETLRYPMNKHIFSLEKVFKEGCRTFITTIIPSFCRDENESQITHDVLGMFAIKKNSKMINETEEIKDENIQPNTGEKEDKRMKPRKKFFRFLFD